MQNITISNLFLLTNPCIVDVRDNYTYNQGHIPASINIPYYNLTNNYHHYLNQVTPYYLYCDSGDKSIEICRRLRPLGYNTINILGGYQEYKKYIKNK